MSHAYDAIRGLIETVADATGDALTRILLGATGDTILYPTLDMYQGQFGETRDTGTLWNEITFPAVLTQVGAEFDRASLAACYVNTSATTVKPLLLWGTTIVDAGVVKSEISNHYIVAFEVAFTGDDNYIVQASLTDVAAIPIIDSKTSGYVEFHFVDPATGVVLSVNDHILQLLACGQR